MTEAGAKPSSLLWACLLLTLHAPACPRFQEQSVYVCSFSQDIKSTTSCHSIGIPTVDRWPPNDWGVTELLTRVFQYKKLTRIRPAVTGYHSNNHD